MTTGKTVALTIWTFISKVMSLLFNMLSRFVIAFLPWSKQLLISELQSTSTGQLKSYQFFCKLDFFSPSIFIFGNLPRLIHLALLLFYMHSHCSIVFYDSMKSYQF